VYSQLAIWKVIPPDVRVALCIEANKDDLLKQNIGICLIMNMININIKYIHMYTEIK